MRRTYRPDRPASAPMAGWFIRAAGWFRPSRPGPGLLHSGLAGVGAVRAAWDAEPHPCGACRLAPSPGPVPGVVLTLPAMIGAVAARIPIRIHQRFSAPPRYQRWNMYRRVRVVDTLLVLIHGPPDAELNRCAPVLRCCLGRAWQHADAGPAQR